MLSAFARFVVTSRHDQSLGISGKDGMTFSVLSSVSTHCLSIHHIILSRAFPVPGVAWQHHALACYFRSSTLQLK